VNRYRCLVLIVLASCAVATRAGAQHYSPTLYEEMRWRLIGPLRGGRTRAATGVPSQPNVFYMAQVNGGVWKSDDYGRTWNPIFDNQPAQSVGAIAVAPSNPHITYVASGEGLQRPDLWVGDGIYKSTDAGETWTHLGLRDGQQIPALVVNPRDPNRLFAAGTRPSLRAERRPRRIVSAGLSVGNPFPRCGGIEPALRPGGQGRCRPDGIADRRTRGRRERLCGGDGTLEGNQGNGSSSAHPSLERSRACGDCIEG